MLNFLLHGPPVRLCLGLACLLSLWSAASGNKGVKKDRDEASLAVPVAGPRGEERRDKGVAFLATTELAARSVDLSALNLTELVNGMLNRALRDSKQFFSLLSVTSYSSFAFHKFSVAIYNISNLKTMDPARFPTRYCYCLTNRTNDLSDFTALLVDIIGNSTSYLTEIFKSTSILSVSQTDGTDCIFICVMTGKSGRDLSDFWDVAEKFPVINYTFTSSISGGLATRGMTVTSKPTATSQSRVPSTSPQHQEQSTRVSALRTSPWIEAAIPSGGEDTMTTATTRVARTTWGDSTGPLPLPQISGEKTPGRPPWETASLMLTSPPEAEEGMTSRPADTPAGSMVTARSGSSQTSSTSGTYTPGTQTPSPTKAPAPKYPQTGDFPAMWPFTPGDESALVLELHQVSRCPQPLFKEGAMTAVPLPLAIPRINPCLMELCRFFQQCLCTSQGRTVRTEAMRPNKCTLGPDGDEAALYWNIQVLPRTLFLVSEECNIYLSEDEKGVPLAHIKAKMP